MMKYNKKKRCCFIDLHSKAVVWKIRSQFSSTFKFLTARLHFKTEIKNLINHSVNRNKLEFFSSVIQIS